MLIDKTNFRQKCKKKLLKSSKIAKIYKDKKIEKSLIMLTKTFKVKTILIYIPFGFEPKITSFIKYCKKNLTLYVPFMEGVSFKIVKYRLPLKAKKYSIKEPYNSFLRVKKIDMAIVPVLGVGRNNKRIGFGKGMYDRFFSSLGYKPITVFVQIAKCYDKSVLTDRFDVQFDYYITPKKIFKRRGKRYAYRDICSRSKFDSRRSYRRLNTKKIRSVQI